MNRAAIAAAATRMRGTSHQRKRRRRGGRARVQLSPSPWPPSSGPASTIASVVSGLMASLAVVVVAILAVLVLVFSDQPATQRMKGSRGGARSGRQETSSAHASPVLVLRGPPPAHVLQQQLALPSARPRTPRPAATSSPSGAGETRPLPAVTVPDRTYGVRLGTQEP